MLSCKECKKSEFAVPDSQENIIPLDQENIIPLDNEHEIAGSHNRNQYEVATWESDSPSGKLKVANEYFIQKLERSEAPSQNEINSIAKQIIGNPLTEAGLMDVYQQQLDKDSFLASKIAELCLIREEDNRDCSDIIQEAFDELYQKDPLHAFIFASGCFKSEPSLTCDKILDECTNKINESKLPKMITLKFLPFLIKYSYNRNKHHRDEFPWLEKLAENKPELVESLAQHCIDAISSGLQTDEKKGFVSLFFWRKSERKYSVANGCLQEFFRISYRNLSKSISPI